MSRDGKLVIAASAIRSLDYGFLSVFLGVYLNLLDFTALQAGLVFSGIMAGSSLSNLVASWRGDSIGRKRMLVGMSFLMVLGGALFPLASTVPLLIVIGLFAMTTSTGSDRTAFLSLDMAILAEGTETRRLTAVFVWYNLIGFGLKAIGALLIAVPSLFQGLGMAELTSFKAMFGIYAVVAFVGALLYARLSPGVEPRRPHRAARTNRNRSPRGKVLRLAAVFSLDAFGGGFMVRSFISFWFVGRFGIDPASTAVIFAVGQVLNAASVFLAVPVAERIGLINTMTYTQVVSNLLIGAMALTGSLWLAVFLYLVRELTNELDIPTRQSYTMAIVPSEARTSAASVTNLARTLAQTVSPGVAGYVAQVTFLGAPFLIGSGIKLVYNGALYMLFKNVKPPGEAVARPAAAEDAAQETEARGEG